MPTRCVLLIVLAGTLCTTGAETGLPTADDVNDLSLKVGSVVGSFAQDSFMLRMQYLYTGRWLNEQDRDRLYVMAMKTSEKLSSLTESQETLKTAIEQYEGDDWDRRYGTTGLWRELLREIVRTRVSQCDVELYAALASGPDKRTDAVESVLSKTEALRETYNLGYLDYLRAQALGTLAKWNPQREADAKKAFAVLSERSDVGQTTAIRGAIGRTWLFGPADSKELTRLGDDLARSGLIDDAELAVPVAIVQRRYGAMEELATTLSANPGARDVFGKLALSAIEQEFKRGELHPDKVTVLEAVLAAVATIQTDPGEYEKLLQWLASWEHFRTGAIVYAYAAAVLENEPEKACAYLVEASRLQKEHGSDWLEVDSEEIARDAVRLACDCYGEERCEAAVVVETFEQCRGLMKGQVADEQEYVYATALIGAGQTEKGLSLLGEMVDRTTEDVSSSLRIEMLGTYCGMLLTERGDTGAERVAALLGDEEMESDPNLSVIKSQALLQMGKGAEAVGCMLRVSEAQMTGRAEEALGVLVDVIGQIERYDLSAELLKKAGADGLKLGQFCYRCLDGKKKRLAGLYAAEAQAISAAGDVDMLKGVERFLAEFVGTDSNDVESLRCRARLLTAQGKFLDAAGLWRRIASAHKDDGQVSGWLRWRAKYYELLCCKKSREIKTAELVHTIEVLQSSGDEISKPWDVKLKSLGGELRAEQ